MELRTDERYITLLKLDAHPGLVAMLKGIGSKFDDVSTKRMEEEINRALSNAWHEGFKAGRTAR